MKKEQPTTIVDYFYAHFMIYTYLTVTLIYSLVSFLFFEFHAVIYFCTVMISLFVVNLFFSKIEKLRET